MNTSYLQKAEELKNEYPELSDLVKAIRQFLLQHFNTLGRSFTANSILESRFTPSALAFNIGLNTCGSKVNIATDMLRQIGYQVKKIHGSIPESQDHAWISVKNPDTNEFEQFDVTKTDCNVTPQHNMIAICNEWEEILDDIQRAINEA